MKIDSSTPSPATRAKTLPQKATSGGVAATQTAASPNVQPVYSAAASSSAEAPFDVERVAEIRQAIADGQLKVNADKIADRLIDGVRELLAKDRPNR